MSQDRAQGNRLTLVCESQGLPNIGCRHGDLTGDTWQEPGVRQASLTMQAQFKSLPSFPMDRGRKFTIRAIFQILNDFYNFFLNLSYLLLDFLEVDQICKAATAPVIQIQMQGHLLHTIFLLIAENFSR